MGGDRAREPSRQGALDARESRFAFREPLQRRIFEFLVGVFIDDYMRKKYLADDSGWQTLPSLAKGLQLSTRSMYDKYGGFSSDIGRLIRRGLLEDRVHLNERGRGGKVLRIRVAYGREFVREHIQSVITNLGGETPAREVALPSYRIAVLPFDNIGPDPSDGYLADGFTEELIGRLSLVSGFDVIARTSVMVYKTQKKTVRAIGRDLWAGTIIEGSVRKAAGKLRISVQVIDSNTSAHLVSESYDKELEDLFSVQAEIAEKVAQILRVKVTPREARAINTQVTESSEAHEYYLRGMEAWLGSAETGIRDAVPMFERAIRADPSFALAYAGLANCYSMLGDSGYIPQGEAMARAQSAARKALDLDGRAADAHLAVAAIRYHDYDWAGAEEELRAAIAEKSSLAIAHAWLGSVLRNVGRLEEALSEYRRAFELDPASPTMSNYLALGYSYLHRDEDALEQVKRTSELNQGYPYSHSLRSFVYVRQSKYEEAIEEMQKYVAASDPGDLPALANLGIVYALSGKKGESARILDELERASVSRHVQTDSVAVLHLLLGETEIGFRQLGKAIDEHCSRWVPLMRVTTMFDPFRSDERFVKLMRRANLA